MEKYLNAVVLLVLNWIKAHIKFCQELKALNIAELQDLFNFVK